MPEKFYFGEPVSPKNPRMEEFISRAYENNPGSIQKKDELLSVLNAEHFDDSKFRKLIEDWNEITKKEKGFEGQSGRLERLSAKHGRLKSYHFM